MYQAIESMSKRFFVGRVYHQSNSEQTAAGRGLRTKDSTGYCPLITPLQLRYQLRQPVDHLFEVAHVSGNAEADVPFGRVAKGDAGGGGNVGLID